MSDCATRPPETPDEPKDDACVAPLAIVSLASRLVSDRSVRVTSWFLALRPIHLTQAEPTAGIARICPLTHSRFFDDRAIERILRWHT